MTMTQTEGKRLEDVVKSEAPMFRSREKVTINASYQGILKCGDLIELSSTEAIPLATEANCVGVFLDNPPNGLVAAENILKMGTVPTADDTVVIDTETYKFVASPSAAGDVDIGSTAAESILNLVAAINGDTLNATAGGHVAQDPVEHDDVVAVPWLAGQMKVIAKVKGSAKNAIATTETLTAAADVWDAATLTGGQGTLPTEGVYVTSDAVLDKDQLEYFGTTEATVDAVLRGRGIAVRSEPATLDTQTT